MKKEILILIISTAVIAVLAGILLWPKSDNSDVRVFSPKSGQEIDSPLSVEGEARGTYFFEGSFPIKIVDENDNVLGTSYVQATSDWMTEDFVAFKGEISFAVKTGGKGYLVFMKDNPSGLPEYDKEFRLPITLKPVGFTKVQVYFNNNQLDPEISCNKVFSAEREIMKIEAIGSAALNELLKGPTAEEQEAGFSTSINSGVRLQSLEIRDETAYADFDEQLGYQVGGSCRVSAIRAQITETLKQFPTVKNVVISINGRTEDILQP